ncbi:MAG: Gfo/Idh/MocA family oxidoreductase [Actinomycetales bacterium]|nr:Gfo/Idh/MocA family oxidoreductase [Actinomycetales bacterium]
MTQVGLVGYGKAGAAFHAPLLRAAGLHVAVVATADPERAGQAARDIPGVVIVPDLTALLARGELGLVVLASPSGAHVANARAVIDAGVPVVVDKPLACDAHSAREVIDLAAAHGVALTVFQNRRYDPEFTTMSDIVGHGVIGQVRRAEFRWERWRPVPADRWREQATPEQGGGVLLDLHTHLLDQAIQLFGPVESVYAELAAWTTTAEDDTFLAARHTGGGSTHLTVSSVSGAPGPRARIVGSTGTYLLGSAGEERTAFPDADGGPGQHGWIVRGDQREAVQARAGDPADFYRQVAAALALTNPQDGMPVDPLDAVHVLAVIDAARVSARVGRVVDVLTPGQDPS